MELPVIDASALEREGPARAAAASRIALACKSIGFFYVADHGIDVAIAQRLAAVCHQFFSLPLDRKMRIRMDLGGAAWRGYFPVGGELTSGVPDRKEGLYFGAELADDHPKVAARTALHGKNLFPAELPEMRAAVFDYMAALTRLGALLMRGIALSLGLDSGYFDRLYGADPLTLFRVFNYPKGDSAAWGVGEHTDYGLLSLVEQDEPGLEIKTSDGWIEAPPIEGTYVCNIGDMLERMTGGRYRSTPHRVRASAGRDRMSFAFFYDPSFDAEVSAILQGTPAKREEASDRWDGASVHDFRGKYGEYLVAKVSKVFPALSGALTTSTG